MASLLGTLHAGAIRQHQCADQIALIFGRHKTTRHQAEQQQTADDDRAKHGDADTAMIECFTDEIQITICQFLEAFIKGLEGLGRFLMFCAK